MKRILGIDSSLTGTGLCRVDCDSCGDHETAAFDAVCATVSAPKPTADKSKRAMARRVNTLIEQIESAIDPLQNEHAHVDLIAIESLAYGAKGDSAWVLPWIFGRCIELAEKYDVPLLTVGTSARAKYATGRGNADKETVFIATLKRWPMIEIANNNEGDALICAAIGCRYLGLPIDTVPKINQQVMDKVAA